MKEWKKPEIEKLDIRNTASGSDPDTKEANASRGAGGWKIATYDSVNWEKCDNGSVTPKKSSTES